jgi:RimJ/RimL family protein N-acetyltransferase
MHPIETDRLNLLLEQEQDFDAIHVMLAQIYEPDQMPPRQSLQDEQKFYLLMRMGMYQGLFGRWIVQRKSDGEFIGLGMLLPHLCTPEEHAVLTGSTEPTRGFEVEIGWALARPYRKQGYGTETARALLSFAFSEIQLARLIGITGVDNPDSVRMLQRLGMELHTFPATGAVLGWVEKGAV